jgi:hypothetical protein
MCAFPASLLHLPSPRRRLTRSENAPAGVYLLLLRGMQNLEHFFTLGIILMKHFVILKNHSLAEN